MAASARSRVLRTAQSGELRSTFRQLAEIDGPHGPKYTRACLADLAAAVAGRTYGGMLLELCHLVRAAVLAAPGRLGQSGFEWLFWDIPTARRSAFLGAFDGIRIRSPARVEASDEGVVLGYEGGEFQVRYGRMPVLAAMMEFLVSMLSYRDIVGAVEPLGATGATRRTVADAANNLSRQVYAALGPHLPTAQEQRRFHAMTAFLERFAGADFTEDDIHDAAVLNFWRDKAVEAGEADFRGFATTWRGFLRLVRVLIESETLDNVDHPVASGDEIDRSDRTLAEAETPEEIDPLEALTEGPAGTVKALTKRRQRLLAVPVRDADGVRRLPLSYLRAACFGQLQNRLSQALRRKADADDLRSLVDSAEEVAYGDQVAELEDAADEVRKVAKACLYVLRQGTQTGPAPDVVSLEETRAAFNALNRLGFDRAAVADPERRAAFAALADVLPRISDQLSIVQQALDTAGWAEAEAEDRRTFAAAFERLYGDRS